MDPNHRLRRRLRAERLFSRGWSQAAVARKLGVARTRHALAPRPTAKPSAPPFADPDGNALLLSRDR